MANAMVVDTTPPSAAGTAEIASQRTILIARLINGAQILNGLRMAFVMEGGTIQLSVAGMEATVSSTGIPTKSASEYDTLPNIV